MDDSLIVVKVVEIYEQTIVVSIKDAFWPNFKLKVFNLNLGRSSATSSNLIPCTAQDRQFCHPFIIAFA